MSDSLLRDAETHPDLFDLKLPATREEIAGVERALRTKLPPSFCDVLMTVGQGSFFDNETLLGVHEIDDGTGDLEGVNRELRERQGLPDNLVVFHLGTGGLHAFDVDGLGPEYPVVALDEDTLSKGDVFDSFDAWYEVCIRAEYESVLGLD